MNELKMSSYSLSMFIAFIFTLIIGIFVYFKDKKRDVNRIFGIYCAVLSIWIFGCFMESSVSSKFLALFWDKFLYSGALLCPSVYLHFLYIITQKKERKIYFKLSYLFAIFFLIFNYLPFLRVYFISDVVRKYPFRFIAVPNLIWYIFFFIYGLHLMYGFFILFSKYKRSSGHTQLQIKYLTIAYLIMISAGSLYFLLLFNISTPPIDPYLLIIFCLITSYAILKHRLMDIRIVFTRATIFIFVYAFILGLPLWFGFATNLWFLAVLLIGILSTIGPFLYSYLRQRAESIIFHQQQQYQRAIRILSQKMLQIRELNELFKNIIEEVYKVINPQFIGLYTLSKQKESFILYPKSIINNYPLSNEIPLQSPLSKALYQKRQSILIESSLNLNLPPETLIVPFFDKNSLYAIMLLGPKPKKSFYLESDFAIFDILSNQTSLALANCIFWQEEKKRLAQEEQIKRQRTMDHFSASMAHEIDNPIFAITSMTGVVKMAIEEDLKKNIPPDELNFLVDRLNRISNDLLRISKMIKSIREFSSQTKGEFSLINFDDVVESFLDIVEPQFKYEGIVFKKEIERNIKLEGNKIHLEEVLVNFATNAIHAVKYNNKRDKQIILRVYKNSPNTFLIEFKDNGYGINPEMLEDIFLDFVTTKASSEGSGMGLARVRKIVENHKGRVWAHSEGENKGATFFVELPLRI